MTSAIGILGGTFDPIHNGHLRPAQEIMHQLGLAQIRLMPNHIPPHRPQPVASSAQRLAMVELAAAAYPGFVADDRELRRSLPSYTFDTLQAMRNEWPDTPICFLMGMDSLLSLPTWYRWQELTTLAHLVVSVRPGWDSLFPPDLARWIHQHEMQDPSELHQATHGKLALVCNRPIDISATAVRTLLAHDQLPPGLLPQKVAEYIREQGIYRPLVV